MKKIFAMLLVLAMLCAALTGCGAKQVEPAAPAAPAAPAETPAAPAEPAKPAEPTMLSMPVSATVTSLNPLIETMQEGTFQLAPYADELFYLADSGIRWYLAEDCTISEDELVYTLKLKNNLKWHDGTQITADDVVFTTECIKNTNNGTGFTNVVFINNEEIKVEKVDDLTVTFTLPAKSASYMENLGKLLLVPAHAFNGSTEIAGHAANLTDIGCGPYKLVEFHDGESLVLEAFDDYYMGKASVDTVVFKVIADASAREVAFKNGEINFLNVSSDQSAAELQNTEGVAIHQLAEGRVKYLAWNKYCSTWDNRDAVKAVFLALNQEEIVKGAYGDFMGTPANSIFCTRNLFYDSSIEGYKQNLEEAKKLAEATGLAGKTIKLHYNSDRSYMEATALMIQQQLKAIDVTVDVQPINANGFFDVVFTDQADYELYLNEYGTTGDPDGVISGMFNGTWGINVDTSKEILEMFDAGRATANLTERAEIYKKLQKAAFDEYLVYPIAYPSYIFATPANLEGADAINTTPVFEDYTKLSFK